MKKITMSLCIILILSLSFGSCSYGNNADTSIDNRIPAQGTPGADGNKDSVIIKGDQNTTAPAPIIRYHTVSFQKNGGSAVSPQCTPTLATAPRTTRQDHVFQGWFRDQTLMVPVIYPLVIDDDMVLYAKWLRVHNKIGCADTSIKFLDDRGYHKICTITPSGFDLETLAKEGYWIEICVKYEVYYKKDYDAPWDIGYAGSPKFEVSITNSDGVGQYSEDNPTSTSPKTKTMYYRTKAIDCINDKIYLSFSTDNIQNIIYFQNITVEYTCSK